MLHSIRQQMWKTQQWPQDWKRSVFIPVPKKCNTKECSNYCTIALISHTSKIMLKILQARLQKYMNWELPDIQAGFRKGRGIRTNCQYLLGHRKSKRIPEKTSTSASLTTIKLLTVWITTNCEKFFKGWEYLTCLLRNLYASQEATVRMDMKQWTDSKLGEKYNKAIYCHPVYLTYM